MNTEPRDTIAEEITERMLTEQFDEHYVIDEDFDEDFLQFVEEGAPF